VVKGSIRSRQSLRSFGGGEKKVGRKLSGQVRLIGRTAVQEQTEVDRRRKKKWAVYIR